MMLNGIEIRMNIEYIDDEIDRRVPNTTEATWVQVSSAPLRE
jgi:hypothetical protein